MQTRIDAAAVVADARQWLLKKDFVPAVADLNMALFVAAAYSKTQLLFELLARFGYLTGSNDDILKLVRNLPEVSLYNIEVTLAFARNSVRQINQVRSNQLNELKLGYHVSSTHSSFIAKYLPNNTSIQKLTCFVDDNFVLYLSRFLHDTPALEELSLCGGSLKAMLSILAALSANKSLRLKKLRITNNTLGTEGAIELAKFIRTQTSLMELRFRDCGFGPIGTSMMMDAIGENQTIAILEFVELSVKQDEHVRNVASKLAANKHLVDVSLKCNEFTNKQNAIIFSALANNTSIQILDMSQQFPERYDFDIEAARALEEMLIKNRTLTTLAFNKYVRISPQAAALLASGLRQSKALRALDLSDCELDEDGMVLILEACTESRSLSCLKLDGGGVMGRAVTVLEDILQSNGNFVHELSIYNSRFRTNQLSRFYLALRKNNIITAFNCFSDGTLFDPESKCLLETLQYYNCTLQNVDSNKGVHAREINLLLARNKKINSGKLTIAELKNIFDEMKKERLTREIANNPYSLQFISCFYAANRAKIKEIENQQREEITKGFLL